MKKRYKYPLYALAALTTLGGITACHVYRNIGGLPDGSRFAHLPYYKHGVFVADEPLPFYPDKIAGEGGWMRHAAYAPKAPLPMVRLDKASFAAPEDFAYYWLGHSSAILELGGQRILIDPVFDNAAPIALPFIVPRFQDAPIEREALPDIDIVLLTHDHYDHLEVKTIRYLAERIEKTGKDKSAAKAPRFIAPLGVGARLRSWGVPETSITELGWEDSIEINGIKYTAERALHFSARWTNDRNKTLWVSYVLEGAGKRLYWSGDSGYGKHFAEIGAKYGGFDIAFTEIDAANPGWPNTHMFPEQAVQSARDVKARVMVPIHWGVFSLGRTPWDQSIKRVDKIAAAKGIRLDVPKMGEKYAPEHWAIDRNAQGRNRPDTWWERIE